MTETKIVKMVCASCGSEDVVRDAWAEWDEDKQEWVLSQTFDDAFCNNEEVSCSLEEVEITDDS